MTIDPTLRDDLFRLYGHLQAIAFPLIDSTENHANAYYDLINDIIEQYESIMNRVIDAGSSLTQYAQSRALVYSSCKHEYEIHESKIGNTKICKKCGINAHSVPCVGGWL